MSAPQLVGVWRQSWGRPHANGDMRNKVLGFIAGLVGTLLAAGAHLTPVQAQNEGMSVLGRPSNSGNELSDPTAADIIKALKPPSRTTRGLAPSGGPGATRSISVAPGKEREALEQGDLPKVDLRIEFEPYSDRLTAASKQVLTALAEALKRPELGSSRFAIVGHTDGRGSERYNQQLSERRAAAVKDYLVRTGGIEESRLVAIGFGKSKPLNPSDPFAAANRRVEIVNLLN
jgi:outer membrane protein OmpA-like peptidoglycan-associated protein